MLILLIPEYNLIDSSKAVWSSVDGYNHVQYTCIM